MDAPAVAARTCAQRLRHLGIPVRAGTSLGEAIVLEVGCKDFRPLECLISWAVTDRVSANLNDEATVQARCGLMHVHGLEAGAPQRIGLEIASVAAGVLATQAVLAALVARYRGLDVDGVETSVMQAGVLAVSQYLARATCAADGEWVPDPTLASAQAGPPFLTSDGHWVELEILTAERWRTFWTALGVDPAALGPSWWRFVSRYATASCRLPSTLHHATQSRKYAELVAHAEACGVALCRVRRQGELPLGASTVRFADVCARPPEENAEQRRPRDVGGSAISHGPLSGLTLLEATSRIQGPLAGLLLAMLGAEVTRIEPPGGDVARMVPPLADGTAAAFRALNREKDQIEIDLESESGRSAVRQLARQADMFVHNWRPDKARQWQLDFDDLRGTASGLVYCHASGWSPHLPPCGAATDYLVQAHAALGEAMRPPDHPPFPSRVPIVDFLGGLLACEGALTGLLLREQTCADYYVETSLWRAAMELRNGQQQHRRRQVPRWGALDRPLPAADGLMVLSIHDDSDLRRAFDVCRVCSEEGVEAALPARSTQAWCEDFVTAGMACGPVCNDLSRLRSDPATVKLLETAGGAWMAARPWRLQ